MRSLTCPPRDNARNHLTSAIEPYVHGGQHKGYPATDAELDSVIALYDAYDAGLGTPAEALKGDNLVEAFRSAIHNGYDFTQSGRKLAALRSELMSGIELCPICGIAPPRELDHHLPRSVYHPLAVYPRNLVPLCHDCNHLKSKSVADDPAQHFLHPYLEEVPNVPFLRASVMLRDGGLIADFDIDPNAAINALTRSRLAFVLERLKLNERYSREINIYLTSQVTALRWSFEWGGPEGVRRYLLAQAEVESGRFHPNHWQPVLLRSLAEHTSFCDGEFANVLQS